MSPRPGNPGRIHVVQVIGTMHIGGAENAVVHIAQGLDRSRFDVTLCCTRERGVLAEQLAGSGVDVRLAAPPTHRQRYFTPYYLARELKRLGADVVHTHGTPSLLHVGPLAMLGRAPAWVHTYHFGNYPLPSRRMMAGERFFSRFATALVAVADVQRTSIEQHHKLTGVRTIVNGVTANTFVDRPEVRARTRAELGIGADEILVGGIAVLSRQKGITYLLQAVPELLRRQPRVRVLVAGGGPLLAPLREEAQALGVADRVIFTGWRQDNLELLTALDVFVMPSLWEAMPLALLEAMAARRAIVVTDVGDNRRVVDDGRCGVVVPAGDPAALAAAIDRLLGDPLAAAAMAARAEARFRRGLHDRPHGARVRGALRAGGRRRPGPMNVLTFGGDYWDGPRHNRHYFLEELGRHERALFVSPPFHLARLIERKGPLYPSGVRHINDGLVNYTPSKWLFENHRSPWLNARMKAARLRRIEALMRRFGVTDPVLLIWHPQYRDMIGRFGERLVVYYAYDQYTGYTGGDAKASPAEIELMERADLVFALSRELAADKRQYLSEPDKVVHLANAANYDMFATSRAPETVTRPTSRRCRPRVSATSGR